MNCILSNTYFFVSFPTCSAAKSWQLGWYSSKADSITPSSSSATYTTKLAGIVDYATTSNKVLLEIQQTSSTTFYYINYNRGTGINVGTQEGKDSVLVVSKDTSVDTNFSMSQAILATGQALTINNFNGNSGETLTITFTSLVNNEATVDVVLTGFATGPTIKPSSTPSLVPSRAPSRAPSTVPSNKPSANTSASPSKMPSSSPSKMPSNSPSAASAPSISIQP